MTKHAAEQKRWLERNPDYARNYYSRCRNDFFLYFKKKYSGMQARCKGQSPDGLEYIGLPIMSWSEWINFIQESRQKLEPMFESWKKNGFKRGENPSIDRIDPRGGYVLGNVQWLTHSENSGRRSNAGTAHRALKP